MTIQEAIKSGKPFRRKAWRKYGEWYTVDEPDKYALHIFKFIPEWMTLPSFQDDKLEEKKNDILATDWEIKK